MTEPEGKPSGGGRLPRGGIVLVLLLAVIWGMNWPAIRVSVVEISPWTFRTICLVVGAATLFALSIARGARLSVPREQRLPLVMVGLLNVTAWHMLSAYGLTMIEAGRGVILAFTFPLWSVLFGAVVLRERITAGRATALLLGLCAMALLIGPEFRNVGRSPLGGLLLLGSAIAWAAATVLMKSRNWSIGSGELAAWQLAIGGAPVVIGAVLIDGIPDLGEVSARAWIGVIYASAIAVAFGQWIWFRLLRILPSAVASISSLTIPIVGVFSSALLLDEPVGWREATALALVLGAMFLVLVGREGLTAIVRGGR
jgi:drug/metabolite transporter (DMT)-like permease